MPVKKSSTQEISPGTVSEHDILFDCPECRKLLVIDDRAAGLKIACPECGKDITVPEPAHATKSLEHHNVTPEDLKRQIEENRMQHTEAVNKYHDHITQANRYKVRIQKLEQEFKKMEEQSKKFASK